MAATSIRLLDLSTLLRGVAREVNPQQIDFTRPLKESSVYLGAQAKRRFDQQTDPDGKPWKKLKRPRNRKRDKRAKGGSGQKILRDSNVLMASASASVSSKARGSIVEMSKVHLEQGSNVDYGEFHQQPDGPGKGIIPRRAFAGITDKDADKITLFVGDHVIRQIEKKFGGS